MIITIDGPAGSGKSTTARALAKRLGALYLDTGALYRSVALAAREKGIDPSDGAGLEKLAGEISIYFKETPEGQRLFLDGKDRTLDIRRPEVEKTVSAVSAHKGVRGKITALQRVIAAGHLKAVVEGRDAGSVVFPNAEFKFYLTASTAERASRRKAQNAERGVESADIETEMASRDMKDSSRKESPLVVPAGAIEIDNTNLNLDATIEKIIEFTV